MSVYFLECPMVNRIKIGTADAPEQRIDAIRLMCPASVCLIGIIAGGFKEERDLHDRFAHLRRHGEWFEATDELKQELWSLALMDVWNRGAQDWRDRAMETMDVPVADRVSAGGFR